MTIMQFSFNILCIRDERNAYFNTRGEDSLI